MAGPECGASRVTVNGSVTGSLCPLHQDILNNLDSCDLEDDDLMLDADLAEDGSLHSGTPPAPETGPVLVLEPLWCHFVLCVALQMEAGCPTWLSGGGASCAGGWRTATATGEGSTAQTFR